MTDAELLPCPFCGGTRAERTTLGSQLRSSRAFCPDCGRHGPLEPGGGEILWASAAFGISETAVTAQHITTLVDRIDSLRAIAESHGFERKLPSSEARPLHRQPRTTVLTEEEIEDREDMRRAEAAKAEPGERIPHEAMLGETSSAPCPYFTAAVYAWHCSRTLGQNLQAVTAAILALKDDETQPPHDDTVVSAGAKPPSGKAWRDSAGGIELEIGEDLDQLCNLAQSNTSAMSAKWDEIMAKVRALAARPAQPHAGAGESLRVTAADVERFVDSAAREVGQDCDAAWFNGVEQLLRAALAAQPIAALATPAAPKENA